MEGPIPLRGRGGRERNGDVSIADQGRQQRGCAGREAPVQGDRPSGRNLAVAEDLAPRPHPLQQFPVCIGRFAQTRAV